MSINSKTKKNLQLLGKILVACFALYFIFTKIKWQDILGVMKDAELSFLALGLLLFVSSKVTSSYRLNVFFRTHQIKLSEWSNLKLYWLGMFYNLFLPGGIGGDGYKVYLLNRSFKVKVNELFSAVFVDRLSGMSMLLFLSVFLFSFVDSNIPHSHYSYILIFPIVSGFYLFLKLFFKRYISIYWSISIFSLLVQMMQLACIYFVLKAYHVEQNEMAYLVLFLLSSIAAVIPISVGGIGVRELCFLYGSQWFSLDEPIAVTISFTFYLITMLGSFPGLYFVIKPPEIE